MADEDLESAGVVAEIVSGGLVGGVVYPPAGLAALPDKGARELALERLRDLIAALVFRRTGATGDAAIPFRVPAEKIHVYQPDDVLDAELTSGIAFLPGVVESDFYGLGPASAIEESLDVHGPGTVVVRLSDHVEPIAIEIWASHHATRRAIWAGLHVVFQAGATSSALRLGLPGYYGAAATFSLVPGIGYVEELDAAKGRRRAQLQVELRVPELWLVNARRLTVLVETGGLTSANVLDGSVFLDLEARRFDPRAALRVPDR